MLHLYSRIQCHVLEYLFMNAYSIQSTIAEFYLFSFFKLLLLAKVMCTGGNKQEIRRLEAVGCINLIWRICFSQHHDVTIG